MQAGAPSYAVPPSLPSDLSRVRDLWEDLKRGEANMPFSDDLDPAKLQELTDGLILVTVFESPLRFRFEWVGPSVTGRSGSTIAGLFSDEANLDPPLDDFNAQAIETVTR